MNLNTENNVPQEDENLLVPSTRCMGSPTAVYAGSDISPPPPAMESIKPARKTSGHITVSILNVTVINCPSLCSNIIDI
jgi:hypothetical protein